MKKNRKLFFPNEINKMSDAEIRKAYSELRSIANKRLNRLQEQDLNLTARTGYRFPTLKEIDKSNRVNAASELADVSKFLRDPRNTVTGEKAFLANFRESMQEKGYGDLVDSIENTYKTIEYMEDVREKYKDSLLPSGDLLDVLQEAERLKIPKDKLIDNIDLFASHLDELNKVKPTKGGRTFSQSRIDALVRKWM